MERLTAVEQRAPGRWQIGTVTSIKRETPRVKSFRIALPMWMPHLPGQHYDVRLTAEDGYRVQRSYSIASSPLDEGQIELTIDRLEDGEVSPYFHDVAIEGDEVEVRGPFTSYFVWRGEQPVLLVGGGSGIVPLMAMLRHRRRTMPSLPMRPVYSVRNAEDVIYGKELGEVTSSCFSPTLGKTLALAYVRREVSEAGARLEMASGAVAQVTALPFYSRLENRNSNIETRS